MEAAETKPPAAESPPSAPGPLSLRRGDHIQLGYRTGTVDAIRGDWLKPNDVRVTWDGQKYPVWIQWTSLELDHARGRLQVL